MFSVVSNEGFQSVKQENNDNVLELEGSNGTSENAALNVALSREFFDKLPKHKIDALIKEAHSSLKRRFKKRKFRKYGNINKGFTEEELKVFLSSCLNRKANLAFRMMANLGLRIGEVVRVNVKDVDFNNKKIYIQTEKAGTSDALLLHDEIFPYIKEWIEEKYEQIMHSEGFLFYAEATCSTNKHISANWLRNSFRETCVLANLNENYGTSDESLDRAERRLHRLTTHSLRHYFITRVYKSTKDPVLSQKLARHISLSSTQVYINTSQRDLDSSMSKVFEKNLQDKAKETEDFKKLVEVWKIIR